MRKWMGDQRTTAGDPETRRARFERRVRDTYLEGTSSKPEERQRQIAAMKSLLNDPDSVAVHSWLHENLTILDSKCQSVLSMLSIALATLTIFYASLGPDTPTVILIIVFLEFALIAWSIVPLARVAFVYWSSTEEFLSPELLLTRLLERRDERTLIIRVAIAKGALSLALFMVLLAWDIASRLS